MPKIKAKLMVIIFAFLVTFAFSQNARGLAILNVTVATDKESYDIVEDILVTGTLTLDATPVSDGLVAIQVDNPQDNLFAIRTRPTGANLTDRWSVEILGVTPCDQAGNPKDTFRRDSYAGFKVTIKNNDLNAHDITVTLNAYLKDGAPFAALIAYQGTIDGNETITETGWPVYIPHSAPLGNGIVYANVFNQLPKDGGFAFCPEKSATFTIASSVGSMAASEAQGTYSASEEGNYDLTFRLGMYDVELGTYTIYVSSFYEMWLVTNSTTFEAILVGDIWGPEGVPDGKVDIDDIVFVALHFGLVEGDPGWDPRADISGPTYLVPDGKIDIDDIIVVAVHFGYHV
jgi:hypothetical protein